MVKTYKYVTSPRNRITSPAYGDYVYTTLFKYIVFSINYPYTLKF